MNSSTFDIIANNFYFFLSLIAVVPTYYFARSKKTDYKELKNNLTYASLIRRFFASLLDAIIALSLCFIVTFIVISSFSFIIDSFYPELNLLIDNHYNHMYIFGSISGYILVLSYMVLQLASRYQATLGMRALGIKLYNADLTKPNIWIILGREMSVFFLSFITVGIAGLMIIWTRRKQGLHDKLARTVVCRQW